MYFHTRINRWVIPVFSLLLAVALCHWSFAQLPGPSRPGGDPLYLQTTSDLEKTLQAKGERVLQAFGEDGGLVVVTLRLDISEQETEIFAPRPETRVQESVQVMEESMRDEKYHQSKSSENYLVGQEKVKKVRRVPKIGRISCYAHVSEQNAARRQQIEKSLFVALGMDSERGDTAYVSVSLH